MATISPRSPTITTSVTPPVTPFMQHAYVLPPLKTLPTWNRNKFKDGNLLRPVQQNKNSNLKVELIGHIEHSENCTQTSPLAPLSLTPPVDVLPNILSNVDSHKVLQGNKQCTESCSTSNKLKQSFDKKIVFLETIHKEVLSSLHKELEMVKRQNKALKFQLVMSSEREPEVITTDTRVNAEIRELKKLLSDADLKNIYLTKLIEQERAKPSDLYLRDHPDSIKSNRRRNSSLKKKLKKQAKLNINDMPNGEYCGNTTTSKKFPEEKYDYIGNKIVFPKLVKQENSRSAPLRNVNCPIVNSLHKKIQEPTRASLPVLQTIPISENRNSTMREKRAKALHVQRQRSNRKLTLTSVPTNHVNP